MMRLHSIKFARRSAVRVLQSGLFRVVVVRSTYATPIPSAIYMRFCTKHANFFAQSRNQALSSGIRYKRSPRLAGATQTLTQRATDTKGGNQRTRNGRIAIG